jgi:hypothetical protein
MAKEIILEDGRTALFDDDASEAEISQKLQQSGLRRQGEGTAAAAARPDVDLPGGPVIPAAASFVNSMAFGLPEMAARSMGGGEYIDAVRQQYPVATTAGDVAGMIPPFKLMAKAGQKAVGSLFKPAASTAEDTMRVMKQSDEANRAEAAARAAQAAQSTTGLPGFARGVATRSGGIATGVMGAQTQAASLGAARNPQNPGAGAQQGAQVFRNVATNLPGTGLVPGVQPTINAVTGVVPGVLGAGAAFADYMSIDEMMRREAAKRALQGPR